MNCCDSLLILIHLLLAEEHAREGEQAGGAVAQHKLRRNVEPTGQPRVVHARVQRTRRHVEAGFISSSKLEVTVCDFSHEKSPKTAIIMAIAK